MLTVETPDLILLYKRDLKRKNLLREVICEEVGRFLRIYRIKICGYRVLSIILFGLKSLESRNFGCKLS